jgi:hypothetical protein
MLVDDIIIIGNILMVLYCFVLMFYLAKISYYHGYKRAVLDIESIIKKLKGKLDNEKK